jgi:hypothetical protein
VELITSICNSTDAQLQVPIGKRSFRNGRAGVVLAKTLILAMLPPYRSPKAPRSHWKLSVASLEQAKLSVAEQNTTTKPGNHFPLIFGRFTTQQQCRGQLSDPEPNDRHDRDPLSRPQDG